MAAFETTGHRDGERPSLATEETLAIGRKPARPGRIRAWTVRRAGAIDLGVIALWTAAAVLAVLAPFRALVTYSDAQHRVRHPIALIDGWGRTPSHLDLAGPRFGIALIACAGCLAALIVLAAIDAAGRGGRSGGLARGVAGLAIGTPCLLAGVTGSVTLYANSYIDQLRFRAAHPPAPSQPSDRTVHIDWGSATWFALIAVACAALATCVYLISTSQAHRPGVAVRSGHDDGDAPLHLGHQAGR